MNLFPKWIPLYWPWWPKRRKEGSFYRAICNSAMLQDGKVMVQVWLADTKKETMSQLKKLGFQSVAQPKSESVSGLLKLSNFAAARGFLAFILR
jgi:hypothetical protein